MTTQAQLDHQAAVAIRARDAGELFSMAERTWWKLNAAGRCPAPRKIGRCTRWDRDELIAWWDAGAPTRSQWESRASDSPASAANQQTFVLQRLRSPAHQLAH